MIRSKYIGSAFFLFLVALPPARVPFSQKAADEILLTVAAIPATSSVENWAFKVTFRNSGTDVNLRLGFVLDGKQYTINVYLILTDSKGISQELRVRTPVIPPGNMKNDVMKLGAGEEHSIKLGIEQLDGWQTFSGTSKLTGTLRPDNYRLCAEFRWQEWEIYKTAAKHENIYREKMYLKSEEIAFSVKQ